MLTVAIPVSEETQGLLELAVPDPVKVVVENNSTELPPEIVGAEFTVPLTATFLELAPVEEKVIFPEGVPDADEDNLT